MGESILGNDFDGRVLTFPGYVHWQLTKKLSEKIWEGSDEKKRGKDDDWNPDEAHAVYECKKIRGPSTGEIEIGNLRRLTAAGCSATPSLLDVKYDVQDVLVPKPQDGVGSKVDWNQDTLWRLPGGYIVYILMTKLQAQPLDINTFWHEFTRQQQDDVRAAFKKSFLELGEHGVYHLDSKLENLMWNETTQTCYIIDLEMVSYHPDPEEPVIWSESDEVTIFHVLVF
ncbi:MAG: hypothetical protein Q9168_004761 [Polycauliona sp. 1 TL-2023]